MSLDAAAALMCRLGWRTVLVQSKARANVPTDLLSQKQKQVTPLILYSMTLALLYIDQMLTF